MFNRSIQLHFVVATLLFCVFVSGAIGATLPTEEEIKGIQTLCGAGNIQSVSVKAKLDAAIESWRKTSVGADIEVAKKNLTGALGQVHEDANLTPVYKVYIECVKDTIHQFLDHEKNATKSQKISTHTYFQMGEPKVDPKTWTGPGVPAPDFKETLRGDAELVPGEKFWISPPNQSIPAERICNSGPSAGWACSLDSNSRLLAYIRVSCNEAPAEGRKVSRGCSRATPLFNPNRRDVMVQCCFYDDGPAANGLQFNHTLYEWISREMK